MIIIIDLELYHGSDIHMYLLLSYTTFILHTIVIGYITGYKANFLIL